MSCKLRLARGPRPEARGLNSSGTKVCFLLVEEDVVLRTEADRLPDFVDGGPDVEAVDLGRAGGGREHPGQD